MKVKIFQAGKKSFLRLLIWLFLGCQIAVVNGQGVGGYTQKVLDNTASNTRPNRVKLEQQTFWERLGFTAGKADYTQQAKINQSKLQEDNERNLLEQLFDFIFHVSSNKKAGFIPANFPQSANLISGAVGSEGVEKNFNKYYCANVPQAVCNEQALAQTQPLTASGTPIISQPIGQEGGEDNGEVEPPADDSVLTAALKIFEIAGKNPGHCGWRRTDHQTKAIVTTISQRLINANLPSDSRPATCLEPVSQLNSSAYALLKRSADYIDWLQCVGFVNGATALAGRTMVQYGDAKTYCNGNFSGYTKLAGSQIKAGDVAIETAGSTGHIYVIKEVRGSVAQKVEANFFARHN